MFFVCVSWRKPPSIRTLFPSILLPITLLLVSYFITLSVQFYRCHNECLFPFYLIYWVRYQYQFLDQLMLSWRVLSLLIFTELTPSSLIDWNFDWNTFQFPFSHNFFEFYNVFFVRSFKNQTSVNLTFSEEEKTPFYVTVSRINLSIFNI